MPNRCICDEPSSTAVQPVLTKHTMDDLGHEVFTPTECRDYLGFKSVEVFGSLFQSDATMLEEMLQDRYDALGIPVHLHRHVGMGYKGFGDEPAEERIHKVVVVVVVFIGTQI